MKDSILIFGASKLQESLILNAKRLNFNTIVIDPDPDAEVKDVADIFEIIDASDFDYTLFIAKKYNVK